MALFLEKMDRNVIPRWRDFRSTVELGELTESSSRRPSVHSAVEFASLESDWLSNRSTAFAADLLSVAFQGDISPVVREAAEFVLGQLTDDPRDNPLRRLAQQILDREAKVQPPARKVTTYTPDEMHTLIASHRRTLQNVPKDAILWVDLSLLYAMEGHPEKAKRAMQIAIALEPHSRFVLRSAARLFIHIGEADRAHALLKSSPLLKVDPWIISAEIATATASRFIPASVDQGIRVLSNNRLAARQTTELSAAVATLEFRDGNNRKAKKHLKNGLIDPNENSLAQAKWLLREINPADQGIRDISVGTFDVERSFEALAWEAYMKQEWNSAITHAIYWMRDQPFSSRPVQFASHIASTVLEEWDHAISLAKLGLKANPHEPVLHMILTFSYGSKGEIALAREHLGKVGSDAPGIDVFILANQGLLRFREGDPEAGRLLYSQAANRAIELENKYLTSSALMYWAREEVRIQSAIAGQVIQKAETAVNHLGTTSLEAPLILARIVANYRNTRPLYTGQLEINP